MSNFIVASEISKLLQDLSQRDRETVLRMVILDNHLEGSFPSKMEVPTKSEVSGAEKKPKRAKEPKKPKASKETLQVSAASGSENKDDAPKPAGNGPPSKKERPEEEVAARKRLSEAKSAMQKKVSETSPPDGKLPKEDSIFIEYRESLDALAKLKARFPEVPSS
jgi:hypothetical protein